MFTLTKKRVEGIVQQFSVNFSIKLWKYWIRKICDMILSGGPASVGAVIFHFWRELKNLGLANLLPLQLKKSGFRDRSQMDAVAATAAAAPLLFCWCWVIAEEGLCLIMCCVQVPPLLLCRCVETKQRSCFVFSFFPPTWQALISSVSLLHTAAAKDDELIWLR